MLLSGGGRLTIGERPLRNLRGRRKAGERQEKGRRKAGVLP